MPRVSCVLGCEWSNSSEGGKVAVYVGRPLTVEVINRKLCKTLCDRFIELPQHLRALDAFAEDLVRSSAVLVSTWLFTTSVTPALSPSPGFCGHQVDLQRTSMHAGKTLRWHKIKVINLFKM